MNTLSALRVRCLASVRVRVQRLSADSRTRRSCGLITGLLIVTFCAAIQLFAHAQEQQEKPFIEPAEMRHKMAVRAAAEPQPAQHGRWETLPS